MGRWLGLVALSFAALRVAARPGSRVQWLVLAGAAGAGVALLLGPVAGLLGALDRAWIVLVSVAFAACAAAQAAKATDTSTIQARSSAPSNPATGPSSSATPAPAAPASTSHCTRDPGRAATRSAANDSATRPSQRPTVSRRIP